MTLQQYLAAEKTSNMVVGWSNWLKIFRCSVFNNGDVVAHGDGGDVLTAIQNAEQDLINQQSAESAKETE